MALYALLPLSEYGHGYRRHRSEITEAAIAMGMTPWQRLRMVELPLAMPVILTGIRVAVVIAVGVATVAAAVGAGGLGTYIFRGLRQNDNNLLVAGALASAILALLCDLALGQFESSFKIGERKYAFRRRAVAASVAAVFGVVLVFSFFGGRGDATDTEVGGKVVVGSKDFTESVILAEILAQLLEKQGVSVTRQLELGGNIAHESLSQTGRRLPEYTGTASAILKHPRYRSASVTNTR